LNNTRGIIRGRWCRIWLRTPSKRNRALSSFLASYPEQSMKRAHPHTSTLLASPRTELGPNSRPAPSTSRPGSSSAHLIHTPTPGNSHWWIMSRGRIGNARQCRQIPSTHLIIRPSSPVARPGFGPRALASNPLAALNTLPALLTKLSTTVAGVHADARCAVRVRGAGAHAAGARAHGMRYAGRVLTERLSMSNLIN
jgi:hypothetical protein